MMEQELQTEYLIDSNIPIRIKKPNLNISRTEIFKKKILIPVATIILGILITAILSSPLSVTPEDKDFDVRTAIKELNEYVMSQRTYPTRQGRGSGKKDTDPGKRPSSSGDDGKKRIGKDPNFLQSPVSLSEAQQIVSRPALGPEFYNEDGSVKEDYLKQVDLKKVEEHFKNNPSTNPVPDVLAPMTTQAPKVAEPTAPPISLTDEESDTDPEVSSKEGSMIIAEPRGKSASSCVTEVELSKDMIREIFQPLNILAKINDEKFEEALRTKETYKLTDLSNFYALAYLEATKNLIKTNKDEILDSVSECKRLCYEMKADIQDASRNVSKVSDGLANKVTKKTTKEVILASKPSSESSEIHGMWTLMGALHFLSVDSLGKETYKRVPVSLISKCKAQPAKAFEILSRVSTLEPSDAEGILKKIYQSTI